MAKLPRNQPCPCGSGRKYKSCCLAKDAAAAAETRPRQAAAPQAAAPRVLEWNDDGLEEASNRVVDLIDEGKLDEAEKAARELLVRYPDMIDGYDRLGMVYRARDDHQQAAHYFRQAAAFIKEHPEGFELESETWFRELADKLDPPAGS